MAGTLHRSASLPSSAGGSKTNWRCQSTRRPSSIVSMAQNHGTKTQAFGCLRAVHSPAVTPVLGSKSMFPRRHREQRNARLITRATLSSFTGEVKNIFALAQEETQRLAFKAGISQVLWSHILQCICILLLDLILNEVNYIQIKSLPLAKANSHSWLHIYA
jgi:ATP-dependent Clp protease ATP-binding subunit ClpC